MLSRRKSTELANKAGEQAVNGEQTTSPASTSEDGDAPRLPERGKLPKGYTPSKRELGQVTPKRPSPHVRRAASGSAPASRKDLTKEQRKELRQLRRERRREISDGMRRGDPQYLPARDQGPERALARDVVDSRRTVGTWFFAGALLVLVGSSAVMTPQVQTMATFLWLLLALAVIVDSFLLCRRVKRLVRERHPDSTQRMGGLYLYTVMRSLTFRRMRMPMPRINIGDKI